MNRRGAESAEDCGDSGKADLGGGPSGEIIAACVERLEPIHEAQVLSYLRLSGIELGLLINFKSRKLVEGIRRLALSSTSA